MSHFFRKIFLVVAFLTIILSGARHASAATFTVDSNADSSDLVTGDGFCIASDGGCTLRAAIEEANALSGVDTIEFDSGMTISVSSALTIQSEVVINGTTNGNGVCSTKDLGVIVTGQGFVGNIFTFDSGSDNGSIQGLIINNYTETGIRINDSVSGITISCNMIGLSSDGADYFAGQNSSALYVAGDTLGVSDITVGGLVSGDGNVIAGGSMTSSAGIYLDNVSNSTFKGNIIGLDKSGLVGFGGGGGFLLKHVSHITIGGSDAAARNIISGHDAQSTSNAILISNDSDHVTIEGNYIGTDITGNTAVPNSRGISDCGATCGGTGLNSDIVIKNNVISGNSDYAINFQSVYSGTNLIQGNLLGVGADHTTVFSQGDSGIIFTSFFADVHNVLVGGPNPGDENIIGGFQAAGIIVYEGTSINNVIIQGNYIGVLEDGTTAAPNNVGIQLTQGDNRNIQIGGLGSGEGNYIKYNTTGISGEYLVEGVSILGNTITDNQDRAINILSGNAPILQNSIYNNFGIDIGDQGNPGLYINPNDYLDADTGPNNYINHPVLISATQNGADVDITYMLDVPVSTNPYRIEFFSNPSGLDPSGFGQGEVYEDSDEQTIASAGPQLFTSTISSAILADGITATLTDCANIGCTVYGGTSEFSNSISTTSGSIDRGTASGTQTALIDNGAYHIIKPGVRLGAAVGADTASVVDAADRDGVTFINAVPATTAGSIGDVVFLSGIGTDLNDVTFSGEYNGGSFSQLLVAIVTTSPSNEDDADYFIGTLDGGNTILGPFKITPGVPQIIDAGVSVTFQNATGHTSVEDNGGLWGAQLIPGGVLDVSTTTMHTSTYAPGATIYMKILPSEDGYLNAWLDGNNDGDFSDEGEQVATNQVVIQSGTGITFTAPSSAGTYNVRFRYTDYAPTDLGPTGEALNGEVEDYAITVVKRGPSVGGPISKKYIEKPIVLQPTQTSQTSGTCPLNQILTQNLKAGARNGRYHPYTQAIVTEVKILQAHMNRLGFKSGAEDGILGPITDGAIKRMQTFLGTKADGYVGPLTRALINKSCGSEGLQKS